MPEIRSAMNAPCKRSASLLERVSNLALGVFVLPLGTVEGREESGENPSGSNVITTIALSSFLQATGKGPSSIKSRMAYPVFSIVCSKQANLNW